MKRFLFFIIISILVMLSSACQSPRKSTYEQYVDIINNNFDVHICVYGDEVDFEYDLNYIFISSIEDCYLQSEYNYLIINFSDSEFDLSENDIDVLSNYLNNLSVKIIFVGINDYADKISNIGSELIDWDQDMENAKIVLIDEQNSFSLSGNMSNDFIMLDFIIRDLRSYTQQ